jgi:TolB-like protein/DNA-binding winged helix-turn-helix (wHTH) protein
MAFSARHVRVGSIDLDTGAGELSRNGQKVRLPEQCLRILEVLAERPGELITRDELRQRLWAADTFVDFDAGLNSAVKKLRDALDDSAEHPRFIETVPRRGYRLIAQFESRDRKRSAPRRYGVAAGAVLIVALAVLNLRPWDGWLGRVIAVVRPPAAVRAIVVLPFENLTGDSTQQYIVDGISDALTTDLAQVKSLRVISRTSAMQYRNAPKRLTEIARELNVDAAVEGTFSRTGDRVIVRAQLIQARGDRHLWARTYHRELRDLAALQAEIAVAIASEVNLQLRSEETQRLARRRTTDPKASDEYLRGRFEFNRHVPGGMLKAIEHFEAAIAADPTYAPPYSGLSDAYRLLDAQGLAAPVECMPKAEAAARRALALDDLLAEAHASLAGVLYRYRWDWVGAEREFRRALELAPSYSEGHRAYAGFLFTMRRYDEAVAEGYRARDLDPLSTVFQVELADALLAARRPENSRSEAERARTLAPTSQRVDAATAFQYLARREWGRAVELLERSLSSEMPNPWLGFAYAMDGRTAEAYTVLARLHAGATRRYVSPQMFAIVHVGLGDRDAAFRWLEEAFRQRAFEMRSLTSALFELLADDPRYQNLLQRLGLAQFPQFSVAHGAVLRPTSASAAERVR